MNIRALKQHKRLTHNHHKLNISDFLTKARDTLIHKTSTALTKLTNKLSETPAVVPAPSRSKEPKGLRHTSPLKETVKQTSISKVAPSRMRKDESLPELSEEKSLKLKALLSRRQELMDKLRKIDQDLMNPSESRVSRGGHLSIADSGRLKASRGTQEVRQHQKNLEMLTRLNNEKLRRQERIVSQMKRKQESELKKVHQLQRNKSKVQAERHNLRLNRQSRSKVQAKFNKFSQIDADIQPISHLPLQPNSQPPTPPSEPYNEFTSLEAPPTISSRVMPEPNPPPQAVEEVSYEALGEQVIERKETID